MSTQKPALESILKIVDKATPRAGYAYVMIDRATGETRASKGFLGAFGLVDVVIYELKLDTRVEIYDVVDTMRIFATREDADIKFRLSVIARSSNADRIVKALADRSNSPQIMLMRVVQSAIKRIAERIEAHNPDGLLANIASARANWQQEIERTINDRVGFDATLIFEGIEVERPKEFIVPSLQLVTSDAPHRPLSVTLHVTLEHSGQAVADPLSSSDQSRADRVRQILGKQFPPEIVLYDVWFDKTRVENALKAAITAGLRSTGYAASSVVMEPVPPPLQIEEQVICTVLWTGRAGRKIEFSVDAVMRLTRAGTGPMDALHLPKRRDWLQRAADEALPIAMHGRDFEDLNLEEQATVGEHVKRLLRKQAQDTGQQIETIVAEVQLPENIWLSKETVAIPKRFYDTRDAMVPAEFSMNVEIQFASLRPVIKRIRLNANFDGGNGNYNSLIRNEISVIAEQAAAQTVSKIESDDYYGSYLTAVGDEPKPVAHETVEQHIARAVEVALRQRLEPTMVSVSLHRDESRLMKIQQLVHQLDPIEADNVEITTQNMRSAADRLSVRVVVRARGLVARHVPITIRRGADNLSRPRVTDSLRQAAEQFLSFESVADILALSKGVARPGSVTSDKFNAFSKFLNGHMEEHYGFSVRLEYVHVSETEAQRAQNEYNAIDIRVGSAQIEDLQDDLKFRVNLRKRDREAKLELIKRLEQHLLSNPRSSQEDQLKYKIDSDEIAKLRGELERDFDRTGQTIQNFKVPPSVRPPGVRGIAAGSADPAQDFDIEPGASSVEPEL